VQAAVTKMKSVNIKFTTIKDVQNFVKIVTAYDGDIDLISGRYIVDAKSIMGIFSLDLMNPIKLEAHGKDNEKLFEDLKNYIVE